MDRFLGFLESLSTQDNSELLETIKHGYVAIAETEPMIGEGIGGFLSDVVGRKRSLMDSDTWKSFVKKIGKEALAKIRESWDDIRWKAYGDEAGPSYDAFRLTKIGSEREAKQMIEKMYSKYKSVVNGKESSARFDEEQDSIKKKREYEEFMKRQDEAIADREESRDKAVNGRHGYVPKKSADGNRGFKQHPIYLKSLSDLPAGAKFVGNIVEEKSRFSDKESGGASVTDDNWAEYTDRRGQRYLLSIGQTGRATSL